MPLIAAAFGACGIAAAQDEDLPDLGFLEYLGSWQDGDDEWLVVAGIEDGLVGYPEAADAVPDPAADDSGRRSRRQREAESAEQDANEANDSDED